MDFRHINAKTKVEIFPIPVISEILANLHGAEWFSTVDLKSAYWQVQLSEETKEITAFTTFKGRFQFKRLPFGLVNAPSHFCKLMTGVLAELLGAGVMAYLDDVVVFSRSVSEHLKKLDTLLCRLGEFGLQVRLEKSKFLFNELECLGHVVSKKGVSADPKKLAAISEMKSPKDKKGLMRVLGTLNYYREFIPRFSSLALPLTELLGNNVKFEWKTRQEIAFRALTDRLVRAPILIFPEHGKQFFLFSDASDDALGAVLCQDKEGTLHPIGYQSKKLSNTERRYPTIKKEALAVKWALEKFRQIIRGQDIIIFTDHRPLI